MAAQKKPGYLMTGEASQRTDGTAGLPRVESIRKRAVRREQAMKLERQSWEAHWADLARFMLPRRSRFMLGTTGGVNRGDKRFNNIIDGTPYFAARTLASGMMAGLTSPARPWFRLSSSDPDLDQQPGVKDWLNIVTQRMREVFGKSNLYQALNPLYGELGVFGTSVLIAEEDPKHVIRFVNATIGTYSIATDHSGRVDSLVREIKMTVRQIVAKFGFANCSERVQGMYNGGHLEQWVEVSHLIEPNDEQQQGVLTAKGKLIRSLYWEASGRSDTVLRESGFSEQRVLAARWDLIGEDIYGTSPGMAALGDAKALQVQEKRKALAIDKWVDPALNIPASMRNQRASSIPGAKNYVPDMTGTSAGITAMYQVKPEIQQLLEDEQQIRGRIREAMFADLFLMLTNLDSTQPITAQEVMERKEEKMMMLGPVLERLNAEFFDGLIDVTFAMMNRRGMIPPPPQVLAGMPLKVEYISILAQAQKMIGLGSMDRLLQLGITMAPIWPEITMKFDAEEYADEYAELLGTAPHLLRTKDQVDQLKAQAAQQQRMQQLAAAAPSIKDVTQGVKNLATSPAQGPSALQSLIDQASGAQSGQ